MLRHVLLLKLKEGVSATEVAALDQAFRRLIAEIPAVAEGRVGTAMHLPGSSGQAADYAVTLDFRHPADFAAYIQDPRHQSFVREVLGPLRETAWSAQIEL
jgi:hypothetical protein